MHLVQCPRSIAASELRDRSRKEENLSKNRVQLCCTKIESKLRLPTTHHYNATSSPATVTAGGSFIPTAPRRLSVFLSDCLLVFLAVKWRRRLRLTLIYFRRHWNRGPPVVSRTSRLLLPQQQQQQQQFNRLVLQDDSLNLNLLCCAYDRLDVTMRDRTVSYFNVRSLNAAERHLDRPGKRPEIVIYFIGDDGRYGSVGRALVFFKLQTCHRAPTWFQGKNKN